MMEVAVVAADVTIAVGVTVVGFQDEEVIELE